jgi:hypothetical protein
MDIGSQKLASQPFELLLMVPRLDERGVINGGDAPVMRWL